MVTNFCFLASAFEAICNGGTATGRCRCGQQKNGEIPAQSSLCPLAPTSHLKMINYPKNFANSWKLRIKSCRRGVKNGVGSVRQRVTKGLSSAKSLYSLRLRFPKCERGGSYVLSLAWAAILLHFYIYFLRALCVSFCVLFSQKENICMLPYRSRLLFVPARKFGQTNCNCTRWRHQPAMNTRPSHSWAILYFHYYYQAASQPVSQLAC